MAEETAPQGTTPAAPPQAPPAAAAAPPVEDAAPKEVKIKVRKPKQRSCNEKDAKGKLCGGHLKRWFYMSDVLEKACGDVEQAFGPDAEIYRCEHCRTLYLPNPQDPGGLNVAGRGQISTF